MMKPSSWKCRKICLFVVGDVICCRETLVDRQNLSDISGNFCNLVSWPFNLCPEKWFVWCHLRFFRVWTFQIFDNPDFFQVFLIDCNPTFFSLPPWKKLGLSEHDVLGFETNLSRVSNIESDNSQNVGLEDYNNISDRIFPHFTTPSIKISLG